MEQHTTDDPTPPGYFRLEELEVFQSAEGRVLDGVNYYLWLNQSDREVPYRFLYALELIFEAGSPLLLSSGDDSESIRLIEAKTLVETARQLQKLHNQLLIQHVPAGDFPLWQELVGLPLLGIHLTKDDTGLYQNDALLLDFGKQRILVQLSDQDGLALGKM